MFSASVSLHSKNKVLEAIIPVRSVRIAPSPEKKAREDSVKDCTYCARHPRNPHRRSLGLGAAHGHVRRSPALRTTPSRSVRTRHRPRHGCPRIQQTHIWKGEDVIQLCRKRRRHPTAWGRRHWPGPASNMLAHTKPPCCPCCSWHASRTLERKQPTKTNSVIFLVASALDA